ncbi:hypothetical protein, partial [Bacteroides sp.]|uniref:hypothetical protein n=1 Tax=Bacteroides sp. TaxID=29523 RepID=UPI00338DEC03
SLIVFVSLSVAKLRPAIAGRTVLGCGLCILQLQDAQPTIGKQSFAYSLLIFSLMQKRKRKGANDDLVT